MKKFFVIITITTALVVSPYKFVYAEKTVTEGYKVSVTILALIGINTPPYPEEISQFPQYEKFTGNQKSFQKNFQEAQTEEVLRNNQTILLTTIVPK